MTDKTEQKNACVVNLSACICLYVDVSRAAKLVRRVGDNIYKIHINKTEKRQRFSITLIYVHDTWRFKVLFRGQWCFELLVS